MTQHAAKSPC